MSRPGGVLTRTTLPHSSTLACHSPKAQRRTSSSEARADANEEVTRLALSPFEIAAAAECSATCPNEAILTALDSAMAVSSDVPLTGNSLPCTFVCVWFFVHCVMRPDFCSDCVESFVGPFRIWF